MQNERLHQIDERCDSAFAILATMTIASALVCCFGSWIPEQLLLSSAITVLYSGIGVMGTMIIKMCISMEQLDNI